MITLWWGWVACTSAPLEGTDGATTDEGAAEDTERPTSPPEPTYGTVTVTVEGRTYELDLTGPVGLTDTPVATMEWRAEHVNRFASFGGFLLDESPIEARTYDLGVWGGQNQRTELGFGLISRGVEAFYRTAQDGPSPGTFTVVELDRAGETVSLSWSGTFDKLDTQDALLDTVMLEGTVTEAVLLVP